MKYKISIVIPIYNLENHISNTLDSLINQTIGIGNLEIIMVNDCSTDNTTKIIQEYADKYENFINIELIENSGLPGKPRNVGLERATSDYVMFMDHDDFYEENACEILYNKINEENNDIAFCNFKSVFDNGTSEKNISTYKKGKEIKIKKIEDEKKILALSPSIWTKIFKREFLIENNIKFPEGVLAEDLSFFIHTLLKSNGIVYLNDYYGYNYRIRNSPKEKSTIHVRDMKYLHAMLLGYYDTYNILKKQKKESYFPIIFEGHLEYWMNCFITGDTNQTEKKYLLQEALLLFKEQNKYGFDAEDVCLNLFNKIKCEKFDDAILIADIGFIFKKRELRLINSNRNLQKKNKILQKKLKSKKKQVKVLQTVKGWFKYKLKNLMTRFKNRFK